MKVSPVGTNAQNGQALLDDLSSITDASASKPYLLYIEPDTYDLGNRAPQMKPFVDIEGSGELNTTIVSAVSQDANGVDCGTVQGADNSEMRFLTAQNTSTSTEANIRIAVLNDDASPRLTHMSAEATGGGNGSIKVALSQLVGAVQSGNTLQCFDNYDENLAAVNCRSATSK